MNKVSYGELILKHLEDYGSITSWEAIKEYGCTRLSAVIYDLRKVYDIESELETSTNRYGKEVRYAKYKLIGIK